MQCLGQTGLQIRLFRIDVGRKPDPRPHVQAPAVEMEKEIDLGLRIVRTVEANDVVSLILDPDPAQKSDRFLSFPRLNIDHQTADFTEKFSPNEVELVVLLLEIAVHNHHLRESQRKVMQRINPGELRQHAVSETGLPDKGCFFRPVCNIESPKKILAPNRYGLPVGVRLQVLKIVL